MLIDRYEQVLKRVRDAARKADRAPDTIRVVGVSKTVSAERVKTAIQAGVTILGENYVQEARKKFNTLAALPASWHFIGHLQTNKAKYAVRMFDLIHSVDRVRLAHALNKQAQKINKVQDILIQVNISGEQTKSGTAADSLFELMDRLAAFDNLRVMGLMTMPPFFNAPEKVRPYFSALRDLKNRLEIHAWSNVNLRELSMGMTGDFEVAIAEGATLVRIGTAIFGERE